MPEFRHPAVSKIVSNGKKRQIIEKVLVAWEKHPELRLGEMIHSVMWDDEDTVAGNLYNLEDEVFAQRLIEFS
jgi:uncharacterized protein YihD (DUF1040 family)